MAALDGKVAIVAGGGTGIGRATAELFASEGAQVVVFGRRSEPLAETVTAITKAGGTAIAVSGDVGREADVAKLVETARSEYGGVDVLVNSAAVRLRSPLLEISAADFAEVLRINLVGAFVLTKTVAPLMLERAAAVELIQDEIRVNVIAPGTIDTAIGMGVPEFRRHLLKHRIPIGRAGHVDDIAQACLYLASDASRYVTGAIIPIDGGWTAS